MVTMQQDALRKAAEGLTTLDEIIRVCSGGAGE
jgi:type II secretory ATPase GspE/PulE/Tfp pilus assembly ATPase PilB-like protein